MPINHLTVDSGHLTKKSKISILKSQMSNVLGFTLIELLVAMTIIAILSTIGFTIYSDAQKKAQDAKIKGDVDSIASALEQHYDTNTFAYPTLPPRSSDSEKQWFNNGIPKKPDGQTEYTINTNNKPGCGFTICADLSTSTTPYCKRSANGDITSDCGITTAMGGTSG